MYLARNIRFLRKQNGWGQDDLASKMGYKSYTTIQKWESGDSEPPLKKLKELSELFRIDMDDLAGRDLELGQDSYYPSSQSFYRIATQRVPLLGAVAAGQPIMAEEDFECYIEVGAKIQCDFCLRVKGDSMVNARIHDGDIVFVRQQAMVSNGEIAVVVIDNEATLKRVFYYAEQAKLILQAENPQYEPFVFVGDELENIRIIGKAIAFQSDVK